MDAIYCQSLRNDAMRKPIETTFQLNHLYVDEKYERPQYERPQYAHN